MTYVEWGGVTLFRFFNFDSGYERSISLHTPTSSPPKKQAFLLIVQETTWVRINNTRKVNSPFIQRCEKQVYNTQGGVATIST